MQKQYRCAQWGCKEVPDLTALQPDVPKDLRENKGMDLFNLLRSLMAQWSRQASHPGHPRGASWNVLSAEVARSWSIMYPVWLRYPVWLWVHYGPWMMWQGETSFCLDCTWTKNTHIQKGLSCKGERYNCVQPNTSLWIIKCAYRIMQMVESSTKSVLSCCITFWSKLICIYL